VIDAPDAAAKLVMSRTRWLAFTELPEFNVAVFALLLNYPWEFSQVPLFAGMADAPHWDAIRICAIATLGDIVIMLIAYWLVAVIARSRFWFAAPTAAQLMMLCPAQAIRAVRAARYRLLRQAGSGTCDASHRLSAAGAISGVAGSCDPALRRCGNDRTSFISKV